MGSGGGSIIPAVLGIVTSVVAPELAPAVFGADGLFGSVGLADALTGAGLSAGSSALTGGNPLVGAAEGAAGGYLSGGGASEIGNGLDSAVGGSGSVSNDLSDVLKGAGDSVGSGLDSVDSALGGSGSIGDDTGFNSLSNLLSGNGDASTAAGGGLGGNGVPQTGALTSSQLTQGDPLLSGASNAPTSSGGLSNLLTSSNSSPISAGGGASSFGNFGSAAGGSNVGSSFGDLTQGDPILSGSAGNNFGSGAAQDIPGSSQSTLEAGGGFQPSSIPNAATTPSAGGSGGMLGNALGTNNYTAGGGFNAGAAANTGASAGASTGSSLLGGGGSNMGSLSQLLSGNPSLGQIAQIGGGVNSYLSSQKMADQLKASQAQSQAELQPFMQTGTAANAQLSNLLGISGNTGAAGYGSLTTPYDPSQLLNNPGYQFQLSQGEQALNAQNAATGMTNSGASQKGIEDFAQGLAGTDYNNAFNQNLAQNQQIYGQLAGTSNTGQQAANTMSGINNNVGLANANQTLAGSNILGGTLSQLLTGAGGSPMGANGQPIFNNNNSNMSLTLSKLLGLS